MIELTHLRNQIKLTMMIYVVTEFILFMVILIKMMKNNHTSAIELHTLHSEKDLMIIILFLKQKKAGYRKMAFLLDHGQTLVQNAL